METFKFATGKDFEHLTDFIKALPVQYYNIGEIVHSARNEIKTADINGEKLVIKYFSRLSPANRFFFTLTGVTKAKNAYRHACYLTEHGINTPEPIGYIDCYKNLFISRSFFVCAYTDYLPVKEMFALPVEESAEGIRQFARWAYQLHRHGIFPGDFNDSNILIKTKSQGIDFQIIDINRMSFGRYTLNKALRNMQRLQTPPEKMGILAAAYAKEAGADVFEVLYGIVSRRSRFLHKRDRKVRLQKLMGR